MFDLLNPADDSVIKSSCDWCHFDDAGTVDERAECQRCHADPADVSDPLNGELKALYPGTPPYGFGTALNVKLHSSSVVGAKYGNWDMSCLNCHNPHTQEQDGAYGTSYGKLIKEYVCYDNAATGGHFEEIVEFTAFEGPGSFADGPPHNENICEMCHTQTTHHQNDGTAPDGQSHNDEVDCMTCHAHSDGFKPGGSSGCSGCHSSPQDEAGVGPDGGRRAVATEFPVDNAHAHYGADIDVGCQVCHSIDTHKDGYVELIDPDDGSIYRFMLAGDLISDPDLSNFCSNCHDEDGAQRLASPLDPFENGNAPPDVATRFLGTLQWDEWYGDFCFGS
jgi:hypothetical protein